MSSAFALLAQAAAATDNLNQSTDTGLKLLIVVALIVAAFGGGVFLSRSLRMADYGWKIGLVLLALLVGGAVCVMGWPPKLGIDLSGGVILVYEVDQTKKQENFQMDEMVAALSKRINPGGTKEITIRPYGAEQVEIVVPEVNDDEVKRIEKVITNIGSLEFRIVANRRDHAADIERALAMPTSARELKASDGKTVLARWVAIEHKQKTIDDFVNNSEYATRQNAKEDWEVLVKMDPFNVTGEYLVPSVTTPGEQNGRPIVEFGFNAKGGSLFGALTGANIPVPGGHKRALGIILDDFIVSAPHINSVITSRGIIEGSFTKEEVRDLVAVLRAGALPSALQKTPSTRLFTGPTLGDDTIRQAKIATTGAMIVVIAFMVIYYRFAGVVASFALVINLLLTVAAMILIKAPFTLTGVAGLALTLGMAVDANVLIYERIREELARGATLRMAIRNGFTRAMTTIIDSNLTTLITAVVLYVVGTDQIKGFAVTLTIGLVVSLFTAIFCSRVVLDVFEKQHWITNLKMMQFVGITNVDFIGKWRICAAASAALILIGVVAMSARGKNMLDIDFLGGTSVQLLFQEPQDIAQVRQTLERLPADVKQKAHEELSRKLRDDLVVEAKTELGNDASQPQIDQHVEQQLDELSELRDVAVSSTAVAGEAAGLRFTFNTSNRKIQAVETILRDLFPGKLAHNSVTSTPVAMVSGGLSTKAQTESAKEPALPATPPVTPSAPEQPKENQGSAVTRRDEHLLALADFRGDELALAQNQEPPASKEEPKPENAAEKPAAPAATTPATSSAVSTATPDAVQTATTTLKFREKLSHDALSDLLKDALAKAELDAEFELLNLDYTRGSNVPFDTWELRLTADAQAAEQVVQNLKAELEAKPVFPASSNIGGKVAGKTRNDAVIALLASMVLIVAYIWLRFEKLVFGLAAVVALVHDVLISIGALAVSAYLAQWLGPVADALMIDPFKIDLTIVAALLTIVGYSLNDTIVVFDRIREVRGKSKVITRDMLNLSINQTLSRTILTGLTTMFVLIILYVWGGKGIHGFSYTLFVGMIVGTFSSIYVASPILLWLMSPGRNSAQQRGEPNFAKSSYDRQRSVKH